MPLGDNGHISRRHKGKNHGNMKVAIFCSANENIEPVYFEKTRELGEWLAKNGDSIA